MPLSLHGLALHRPDDLAQAQPFSSVRCLISVFSYALLLSDVMRAGLGVREASLSGYNFLEPNTLLFLGPYAYPVTPQLMANATGGVTPLWPYKYDTTSVGMRALVKHLDSIHGNANAAPMWPRCVTYDERCDEQAGIPSRVVFQMIDSLVDKIQHHPHLESSSSSRRKIETDHLTFRVQYAWFNRLHDYVFPWVFSQPLYRTGQAIYYNLSTHTSHARLCGGGNSNSNNNRRPRLHACDAAWTNFSRSCGTSKQPNCHEIASVWTHIPARLQKLRGAFPDHTVDFVVIESVDDSTRSSLTSQGSSSFDIVTLARVRNCTGARCETVAVDDFRYEAGTFTVNAATWFPMVATLRLVGQAYAWLRLLCLFCGCYVASSASDTRTGSRVATAAKTMLLMPSQIAIYGSLFPITCYAIAHLIDGPAVYELMGQRLISFIGVLSLDFVVLVRVCAVSMRSVWIVALVCHLCHALHRHSCWSPTQGVLGVPEFSLTFVAAVTMLAPVRLPPLRDCRILEVYQVVPSLVRSRWYNLHLEGSKRSSWNRFFFGSVIDYKCIAGSLLLYALLRLLLWLAHHQFPKWVPQPPPLVTRTLVPYSVGPLVSTSALVVSWPGQEEIVTGPPVAKRSKKSIQPAATARVAPSSSSTRTLFDRKDRIDTTMGLSQLAGVRNLLVVENRTAPHAQAVVCLMNLGVMTDPLTYLHLRFGAGQLVGVYIAKRTTERVHLLLPYVLTTSQADLPIDWNELELLFVVNTRELDWWMLLQCG